MCDQEQHGIGGWFFEFFEQRICGVRVHLVGAIHDHDPPAVATRRHLEKAFQAAHLFDADHIGKRFAIGARPAPDQA